MGLNRSSGNMYGFITHTWNTIKGKCYHDCSYCYMKRFKNQKEVRFDEKELKTDLGENNFIFVGSSCDMFNEKIPYEWISKTLKHCKNYDNTYLFQTKNPLKLSQFIYHYPEKSILCLTLESNCNYPYIMNNSPLINERVEIYKTIVMKKIITIEPILDFGVNQFVEIIKSVSPFQVNIGADSGNNHLPEPPKEKVIELITELNKFTKVHLKDNLSRIIKS